MSQQEEKRAVGQASALVVLLLLAPVALADALTDIQERGSLRIGVSMFAPWTLEDSAGELEGFEIDVGRRVAEAIRVKPEFKVYMWNEIIDGLQRGEVDMIAAGMAITPLRATRVDFSDPYSESGFTVVVNTNVVAGTVESINELDRGGFVIAAVDETLSGQAAPLFFDRAVIEVFGEPRDAEAAVLSGRADAYVTSVPEANVLVAKHPDQLTVPLADPLAPNSAGFAVKRGNDALLDYLNEWISGNDAQQWLKTTHDRWFRRAD